MNFSLLEHLNQRLLPQLIQPLAELIQLSPSQAEGAARQVMASVVGQIVQAYDQRGAIATEQIFHANALQNINREQTLTPETMALARDTGRPLLDLLYLDTTSQQAEQQQLMQQHALSAQQAQDLLQSVLTLSLRSLALRLHDEQIEGESFEQLISAARSASHLPITPPPLSALPLSELPLSALPPTATDAVQTARAQEVATVQTADTAQEAATPQDTSTQQTMPIAATLDHAQNQQATPSADTTRTADPSGLADPAQLPSAQTRAQQKIASRWSKYTLHAVFGALILIPLLVFWTSCSTTQKTSIERNNQTPNVIDSGSNGAGNVLPAAGGQTLGSAPTSPAANDIVPNAGDEPTTELPVGVEPPINPDQRER